MGPYLAVIIYGWLSHAIGFVIARLTFPSGQYVQAITLWAFAALVVIAIQEPLLVIFIVGAAMLTLAPQAADQRAAYFLIAALCLPHYIADNLPLPGIQTLVTLTHYKMAVVVLLLPMFATANTAPRLTSPSIGDALLAGFIIYTTAVVMTHTTETIGMRHGLDLVLTMAIPYFAIQYAIRSKENLTALLNGLLVATIFLAAITLVATAKQWDFYRFLEPPSRFSIPDVRTGFLRISATVSTHALGFHLALGALALEFLKRELKMPVLHVHALRGLFLLALFFTNSRGAIGGLAIGYMSYLILSLRSRFLRWSLIAASAAAVVGMGLWLLFGDHSQTDIHGTFAYRQELAMTSVAHILANPIFGDFNYIDRMEFMHLIQGQGIIDITNYYLQVALPFGLLGAGLLFAAFILPIVPLIPKTLKIPYDAYIGTRYTARKVTELRHQPFGMAIALAAAVVILPIVLAMRALKLVPSQAPATTLATTALATPKAPNQPPPTQENLQPEADARSRTNVVGLEGQTLRDACAFVIAGMLGWLFFMSTTSDHGLTVHFGILLAAMARVVSGLADNVIVGSPDAVPANAPSPAVALGRNP